MINQISVFLENKAGELAEITKVLAENNVNLRAISIAETADYGVLRMIADDSEKATRVLMKNGNIISMTPVSVIEVPDRPAGLSDVLGIFAKAEIDIEYMYSLFAQGEGKAYMVFRVADKQKLIDEIKNNSLKAVSEEELGLK